VGRDECIQALERHKSNIRHRLHTLEARGLLVIKRTPGVQAHAVKLLTAEGQKLVSAIEQSCD